MRWRSWDFMTRIVNQQLIKDYLMGCFQRDLRVRLNLCIINVTLTDNPSHRRTLNYTPGPSLDSCSAWTPSGYVLN